MSFFALPKIIQTKVTKSSATTTSKILANVTSILLSLTKFKKSFNVYPPFQIDDR